MPETTDWEFPDPIYRITRKPRERFGPAVVDAGPGAWPAWPIDIPGYYYSNTEWLAKASDRSLP